MKELAEYRLRLIDRLEEAAREFIAAGKTREPFMVVAGSEWTIHQFVFHVRDVDKFVYGERIRRTLNEHNPTIKNFDADGWMALHYKKDEAFESILDEFQRSVAGLCEFLRGLPAEAWSRESRHETLGGGLTLQLWVERGLAHIEEHLKALK